MVFLLLVILISIINTFFIRVLLECTEAITTSLITLVTNFPEICTFIIGFSFTVWTRMWPLLAQWYASYANLFVHSQ